MMRHIVNIGMLLCFIMAAVVSAGASYSGGENHAEATHMILMWLVGSVTFATSLIGMQLDRIIQLLSSGEHFSKERNKDAQATAPCTFCGENPER